MLEKTVPEATVELLHGLLHLSEHFAVLRAVHGAIDNDERSKALPAEAAPDHNSASTILDSRDKVVCMVPIAYLAPRPHPAVRAKQFEARFIAPDDRFPLFIPVGACTTPFQTDDLIDRCGLRAPAQAW